MIAKPLAAAVAVLAVALTGGGYWFNYLWKTPTELLLPGTVETQEVRLSSRVGGRVSKILVKESDLVEAGQPIVELEMPELDSQRSQLEAQKQAAEAVLARLRKGPRDEEIAAAAAAVQSAQARVDRMKKGYRSEEKEQARSEQESLNADLENALQDLNRERTLLGKGASTNAAYEAAVARYGRLLGQANAAGAKLRMLESGYRPEEVAETVAELARLQANLDLLKAGTRQEEIDEAAAHIAQLAAQIDELDVKRRERTVYAPEPAVVEILSVRPGDIVEANQPVARVLRAGDMWVKAYISEIEMGRIRLGQKVEVTIDSFPTKRFEGVVTHISTTAEFTPRNVQTIDERRHQVFGLKVRVADSQGVFKSGMAANVWLPLK